MVDCLGVIGSAVDVVDCSSRDVSCYAPTQRHFHAGFVTQIASGFSVLANNMGGSKE